MSLDVLNATFHENDEELAYDARFRTREYIKGLPAMAIAGAKVGF